MKNIFIFLALASSCAKNIKNLDTLDKVLAESLEVLYNQDDPDLILIDSITLRNVELFNRAISEGANVNFISNIDKSSPLIYAVSEGYEEMIELLLNKDANVNYQKEDGYTALMIASEKGNKKIVELLLEKGANVNSSHNMYGTSLTLASEFGHPEVVELLINKGANINFKDFKGFTPLMHACSSFKIDTVKVLIEKGANVNEVDNKGNTAAINIYKSRFINKSENPFLKSFKKILESNTRESNIDYNLNLAQYNKGVLEENYKYLIEASNILDMLLDYNIKVNIKNEQGETLLRFLSGIKEKYFDKEDLKKLYNKATDKATMILKNEYFEMKEEYIKIFISLEKKNSNSDQDLELKNEIKERINLLNFIQNLPNEIFFEIVSKF